MYLRSKRWLPASVLALRQYSSREFLSDLVAGVTVGLVALPLAMAFAISSGMSPQAGLYCAVFTHQAQRTGVRVGVTEAAELLLGSRLHGPYCSAGGRQ